MPYFVLPSNGYSLDIGVVQVAGGLTAASGAPNTTPQGFSFAVPMRPDGGDRTLMLSAIGAGAVPTAVTVNLLHSSDAGATWQTYATGLALVTASVASPQKVVNVVPGLYAVAASTVTLGGASSIAIEVELA